MQLSWRELCRSQIIQWLKSHVFYSKEENNIIITAKKNEMG